MADKADLAVFIGRFQPFHLGHLHVISEAFNIADRVLVLIGSADSPRSYRNPFTYDERASMVRHGVSDLSVNPLNLLIVPLSDQLYADDLWIEEVQHAVNTVATSRDSVVMIGHSKDATSYYLKKFPHWGAHDVSGYATLSSTEIRDAYLHPLPVVPRRVMPENVEEFLWSFSHGLEFRDVLAEAEFVRRYRESWRGSPYAPTFVTVDAVVIQSGNILLVTRRDHPGKGLLAFPGGFLDPKESIRNAVVRELKEETRISDHLGEMPPAKLASFIEDTQTRIFDDPNRDPRGRVITHAHLFRLPDRPELCGVSASSDAAEAKWYPIGSVSPEMFYADHWHILRRMIGG